MKKQQTKNVKNKLLLTIFLGAALFTFLFFILGAIYTSFQPDKQCLSLHETMTKPPTMLKTAKDFFELANYQYDRGECEKAIINYSLSIKLDPQSAETYNNRAYTYMRMQNYPAALADLDKAIDLKPKYVNALMNRGDIYNYYYKIDRQKAIADYDRVIQLVPPERYRSLSLCGHRLLAQNNGWRPYVLFLIFTQGYNAGCH